MTRGGTVYMMASLNNNALYTGVTSDLIARVQEHKNKVPDFAFTSKYHCIKLVYYNSFFTIDEALLEEKRINGGSRKKKEILINAINPE